MSNFNQEILQRISSQRAAKRIERQYAARQRHESRQREKINKAWENKRKKDEKEEERSRRLSWTTGETAATQETVNAINKTGVVTDLEQVRETLWHGKGNIVYGNEPGYASVILQHTYPDAHRIVKTVEVGRTGYIHPHTKQDLSGAEVSVGGRSYSYSEEVEKTVAYKKGMGMIRLKIRYPVHQVWTSRSYYDVLVERITSDNSNPIMYWKNNDYLRKNTHDVLVDYGALVKTQHAMEARRAERRGRWNANPIVRSLRLVRR